MVTRMKANYRDLLLKGNEWIDGSDEYGLILTDDIDSLLSCSILKQKKNWNVEQILLFKACSQNFDAYGETLNATHEAIGVDLALTNGKCFDNHLTRFSPNGDKDNPQSINLNRIEGISRYRYKDKYNLSTVLLLWSLYDLPKEKLSDELMMLLIAIDGSFDGFYTQEQYIPIHEHWIRDVLELPEFLKCERRHTRADFEAIQDKYKLKEKIKIKKSNLYTDIDIEAINELLAWETDIQIELPADKFYQKAVVRDNGSYISRDLSSIKKICENPFCSALTKKNYVCYSEIVEVLR